MFRVAITALTFISSLVISYNLRYYWPTSVEKLAGGRNKHTHVEVRGLVAYSITEDDGDVHIKLVPYNDSTSQLFIIAECIPKLPCIKPKIGDIVVVRGISRFDAEHGWHEVHPVEQLTLPKVVVKPANFGWQWPDSLQHDTMNVKTL